MDILTKAANALKSIFLVDAETVKAKTRRQPSAASLAACDWEFMATNLSIEQLSVNEAIVKVVEEIREFAREIASKLSTGGNLIATLERFCQSARVGCKLNRKKKKSENLSLLRDPECLDYVLS